MTKQVVDKFIIDGKEYSLVEGYPLKDFLKKKNVHFFEKIIYCRRGYVATWELKENKLYLISLDATIEGYQNVELDYLFPNKESVFAEWFSGKLMLSQGEIIHKGTIADYYREYIVLEFKNGNLISKSILDGREYLISVEKS